MLRVQPCGIDKFNVVLYDGQFDLHEVVGSITVSNERFVTNVYGVVNIFDSYKKAYNQILGACLL